MPGRSILKKFMMNLDEKKYGQVYKIAEDRGVKVQELIRTAIIPEWLHWQKKTELKEGS